MNHQSWEVSVLLLRNTPSFLAAGAAVALLALPLPAAAQKSELERVSKSTETLTELMRTPDDQIPEHILQRAEAIVVIPNLIKGGFILGAENGKGVMSVRDAKTGGWSVPSFVAMTGGSIGWQIGAQAVDLVLVVMNKDGVADLLASEFKLGGEGSVAAGPVGRTAQAATDAKMGAKILAYSRAKGLFAGLSLQGSSLRDDKESNKDVYGREYSSKEVFAMAPPATLPAEITKWQQTLRTSAPATR
jgi:lipid-binding SYLF domain-containing protein